MEQVPASLSQGKLKNHNTRAGYIATGGNIFRPDQFSGFGGCHVKAAYELMFVPFKVCCHLGYGQSSTRLVGYDVVVILCLTTGAGVRLQCLP